MATYNEDKPKTCPERQGEDCLGRHCAKYVVLKSLDIEGCGVNVQARVLGVITRRLER